MDSGRRDAGLGGSGEPMSTSASSPLSHGQSQSTSQRGRELPFPSRPAHPHPPHPYAGEREASGVEARFGLPRYRGLYPFGGALGSGGSALPR